MWATAMHYWKAVPMPLAARFFRSRRLRNHSKNPKNIIGWINKSERKETNTLKSVVITTRGTWSLYNAEMVLQYRVHFWQPRSHNRPRKNEKDEKMRWKRIRENSSGEYKQNTHPLREAWLLRRILDDLLSRVQEKVLVPRLISPYKSNTCIEHSNNTIAEHSTRGRPRSSCQSSSVRENKKSKY